MRSSFGCGMVAERYASWYEHFATSCATTRSLTSAISRLTRMVSRAHSPRAVPFVITRTTRVAKESRESSRLWRWGDPYDLDALRPNPSHAPAHSPSIVARPSSFQAQLGENAMAASRDSTTMPTLSIALECHISTASSWQ